MEQNNKKKNTVLIDARKSFEYDVGSFKKSLNPNIENFREFPKYLKHMNPRLPLYNNIANPFYLTGQIDKSKQS